MARGLWGLVYITYFSFLKFHGVYPTNDTLNFFLALLAALHPTPVTMTVFCPFLQKQNTFKVLIHKFSKLWQNFESLSKCNCCAWRVFNEERQHQMFQCFIKSNCSVEKSAKWWVQMLEECKPQMRNSPSFRSHLWEELTFNPHQGICLEGIYFCCKSFNHFNLQL